MSHETNQPVHLRCLLCDASDLRLVWSLTGRDVRALWRVCERKLSEAAFGALTPDSKVAQFECASCGFRFFDPSLAGSGRFYEELEQASYYVETRPEFEFALQWCRREETKSVLDVGCGEGAFLDLARRSGLMTYAVELNAQAAEVCARKGHRTLRSSLEDISVGELDGGVDALTLFQVVEHVPSPREFLGRAARLVRSGGFIVVAVPNEPCQRRMLPFDPANMPPHHVSRWRQIDLDRLGAACGLNVQAHQADVLFGSGIAEWSSIHNRLVRSIGRRPRPGGNWLPKAVSFLYRKLGLRHFLPLQGMNIYAAFRKP